MLEDILNAIKNLGWHWSLNDDGLIEIETFRDDIPVHLSFKAICVYNNPLEATRQALEYIQSIEKY